MEIDTKNFLSNYGPEIRVMFKQEILLCDPSTKVSLRKVSRQGVQSFFLPWYLDTKGVSCNYNDPSAGRIRVQEAVENMDTFPNLLEEINKRYGSDLNTIMKIIFFVVGRDDGKQIILDGCHRIIAALRLGVEELEYFDVYCKNMKDVCPDFI